MKHNEPRLHHIAIYYNIIQHHTTSRYEMDIYGNLMPSACHQGKCKLGVVTYLNLWATTKNYGHRQLHVTFTLQHRTCLPSNIIKYLLIASRCVCVHIIIHVISYNDIYICIHLCTYKHMIYDEFLYTYIPL